MVWGSLPSWCVASTHNYVPGLAWNTETTALRPTCCLKYETHVRTATHTCTNTHTHTKWCVYLGVLNILKMWLLYPCVLAVFWVVLVLLGYNMWHVRISRAIPLRLRFHMHVHVHVYISCRFQIWNVPWTSVCTAVRQFPCVTTSTCSLDRPRTLTSWLGSPLVHCSTSTLSNDRQSPPTTKM
jgi:hypothetical protein